MIFDAHTHIFRELQGIVAAGPVVAMDYGRVKMGAEILQMLPPIGPRTAFPPEVLLACMDWAGVDMAMLLQGPFYGDQNADVLDAVQRYPLRFVGAAYFDPWAENARATLTSILAADGFHALKLECSVSTGLCGLHPEARLDEPELAWLWTELERAGLALVIDLGAVGSRSYQTKAVRKVAEQHPRLRIVIPHLGQIGPAIVADAGLRKRWEEQIDLGRLPNVWFDTASLPMYFADEDYPYPTVAEYLRIAVERIGPEKVLWGSDAPGTLGHLSYAQLTHLAKLHTRFLSTQEQSLLLGENALRVYRNGWPFQSESGAALPEH